MTQTSTSPIDLGQAGDLEAIARAFFAGMGPTLEHFKQTFRQRMAADVIWESVGLPPHHGLDACLDYLDVLHERTGMVACTIEIRTLAVQADTVMTERVDTMLRADGSIIATFRLMGALTFREGLVVRYTDYLDTAQALQLAAAGSAPDRGVLPPTDVVDSDDWRDWATAIPASRALGLACIESASDRVITVLEESSWPLNPNGALHGGLVLAAADHTMGLAAMAAQPRTQVSSTATLTTDFEAPALAPVRFEATVTRAGGRLCFVSLVAINRDGVCSNRSSGLWAIHEVSE